MKIVLFIKSATILYTKMYVYMCLWSDQWAVGIMGCRNNGPSELWAVGIMTRNRFWVGPQIPCGGPQLRSAVFTPPLKDAFYSVPIAQNCRKYLKFKWQGMLFQFTALVMGLASSPRIFTKILKPIYAHLRQLGHISNGYLDDSYLMGYTYDQCVDNINEILAVMRKFGFTPNIDKSVLIPTHIIEHLGFIINSIEMTVSITKEKYEKLSGQALHILNNTDYSIRDVSRLIGIMVACCTGVEYGELFCKQLEIEKITALRINNGDFDCTMVISKNAKADVEWWLENARKEKSHTAVSHML